MDALGHIGKQLEEHVSMSAERALEATESSLFDMSQLKLSGDEQKVFDCLGKEPVHIEQIIVESDLAPGSVNAALISLRLKGLIKQLPGSLFVKR